MNLKLPLKQIATIQTGVFAKTVPAGSIVYLQAKHFDEHGTLNATLHPDLNPDPFIIKHLLQPSDILFAAKGTKNFAACYESKNLPAVASTSFFVIRMHPELDNKILPDFLVWYINHQRVQKFLKDRAIGTSIVSISKIVLEELEITIPNLTTQKAILKIEQLRSDEKKLKQQIESLREQQIQQQIINIINQ